MNAKDYLQQAFRLNERINSKLSQMESLKGLATKCTSNITGMPHAPSPSTSRMEDTICKIIDLEEDINRDIDALVDLKVEMTYAIKAVENVDERLVLEFRYLCYKSWEEIAVEMNWRVRHVYEVHTSALENFKIPANAQ